jgi:hypothetical protein
MAKVREAVSIDLWEMTRKTEIIVPVNLLSHYPPYIFLSSQYGFIYVAIFLHMHANSIHGAMIKYFIEIVYPTSTCNLYVFQIDWAENATKRLQV